MKAPRPSRLFIGLLAMLAADHAIAQDLAAQDLATRLKPQESVIVTLADGRVEQGTVETVMPAAIRLMVNSQPVSIDLSGVREIRKRGDSLWNGTLIGLFAGLGGAVPLGWYTGALCANEGGQNCPEIVVSSWMTPLALGALFGAAADASRVGTTLVYGTQKRLSFAPLVGPHTYGISASVTLR